MRALGTRRGKGEICRRVGEIRGPTGVTWRGQGACIGVTAGARSATACSGMGEIRGCLLRRGRGHGHDVCWATSASVGARYSRPRARCGRSQGVDADASGGRQGCAGRGQGVDADATIFIE